MEVTCMKASSMHAEEIESFSRENVPITFTAPCPPRLFLPHEIKKVSTLKLVMVNSFTKII